MARTHNSKRPVEEIRRRLARKRRDNARIRQSETPIATLLATEMPAAFVRIYGNPLATAEGNVVRPVLMEDRPQKHADGRYKMTHLARHLNIAVGVRTLVAYHELAVLFESGARAKEELKQIRGGPGDIDYRLGIGREHLHALTGFDAEIELKASATRLYGGLRLIDGSENDAFRQKIVESVTNPVRLAFRAYERAQMIDIALAKAAKENEDIATILLTKVFTNRATHMTASEAFEVARFTDINPARLWIQYAAALENTFEMTRFVGRICDGAEASLAYENLRWAEQILASESDAEGQADQWFILKKLIDRTLSVAKFGCAVKFARAAEGLVSVARTTRDVCVLTPDGHYYDILPIPAEGRETADIDER